MNKRVLSAAIATLGLMFSAATTAATFVPLTNGNPGVPGDGTTVSSDGFGYGLTQPFSLGSCTDGITVAVFPTDSSFVFNGREDFAGLLVVSPVGGSGTGVGYSGSTFVNGVQGYFFNVPQSTLQFIAQVHSDVFGPTTVADLTLTGLYFGVDYGVAYLHSVDAIAIGCGQGALPPLNRPPVVDSIVPSVNLVPVSSALSVMADFIDPDSADTFEVSWDWGDGTTSQGTVSGDNASGSATANGAHSYAAPGVYTIKLRVTDNSGGVAEAMYQYIVAYDPSGGFVTGGGWINSPAGAYRDDPSASGKATFGFVARYQPGKTAPDGNTEFQFKSGNMNFKSSSYEWLVIAGARGQYKGYGTINGSGSYRFMLTAVDGDLEGTGIDRFRIRIWRDGSDIGTSAGLVYDTQYNDPSTVDATTTLGGGTIVIHRR